MRKYAFWCVILLVLPLLAACSSGPKAEARRYADRMPERIGLFRLEEDDTIELTAETISNTGHVTLVYEARDIGEVFVTIKVYGTSAAAEVELASRQRDLRLMGVEFQTNRAPRYRALPTADETELPGGRLAIFENDEVIIEVQFIKDNAEVDISPDDWEAALTAVREVGESLR